MNHELMSQWRKGNERREQQIQKHSEPWSIVSAWAARIPTCWDFWNRISKEILINFSSCEQNRTNSKLFVSRNLFILRVVTSSGTWFFDGRVNELILLGSVKLLDSLREETWEMTNLSASIARIWYNCFQYAPEQQNTNTPKKHFVDQYLQTDFKSLNWELLVSHHVVYTSIKWTCWIRDHCV
jgi:hypothetical protein